MNLEQATGLIRATMDELKEQLERPRDLDHYHTVRAARSTYQALQACLEGIAQAFEQLGRGPARHVVAPVIKNDGTTLTSVSRAAAAPARSDPFSSCHRPRFNFFSNRV